MSSHYVPNTKMPTLVFPTSGQASRHVALMIESLIRQNNSAGRPTVLGLATGSTPVGLYRELIRLHKEAGLDFSPRRHLQPRRILSDAAGRRPQLSAAGCTRRSSTTSTSRPTTSTSPTARSRRQTSRTIACATSRRSAGPAASTCKSSASAAAGTSASTSPARRAIAGRAWSRSIPVTRRDAAGELLRRGERPAPGHHDGRRHHPRSTQDRHHGVRRAQGPRSSAGPSKRR